MANIIKDPDNLLSKIAHINHEWFNKLIEQNNGSEGNIFIDIYKKFFDNTRDYLDVQQQFYKDQIAIWHDFFQHDGEIIEIESHNLPVDKRFSDPNWETNPFFVYLKNSYLTMSEYLLRFVTKADMDEETKERLKFFMKQYLDAISPTNFALTNPEVIKSVIETGGASLVDGMTNMIEDIHNGYIAMTDESVFSVGSNLAITPGKVIYRNELIELIQYSPSTDQVYTIPLLITPPCINKYYILDLQEDNSFVRYLVSCGFTVFLISWKSADRSMSNFSWDEYVELGVIKALKVIRDVTKIEKINTIGYCIGGIILTTAYLVLEYRKLDWINTIAHMTTMLDHTDPGDIKFFIDKDLLNLKNVAKQHGGIMSGRTISQTFSALRANELIWNYWVNNYLLGKTPQPFDILYWNNDAVDLPVMMHSFLLKNMYLNNELVKGKLKICDVVMDITKVACPNYLFAAQKDHIVPWLSAYKTIDYIKGPVRFVLGASGHTAGVVNPVSSEKRNYWINDNLVKDPLDWFHNANEKFGSWWKDYNSWLQSYSGIMKKSKKTLGNQEYKPICNAPGEYVKAKAMSVIEAECT